MPWSTGLLSAWRITEIMEAECVLVALLNDAERFDGGVLADPNVLPHWARSLDGGATWTAGGRWPIHPDQGNPAHTWAGFGLYRLAGLPDGKMFAITDFSYVYSEDAGATWVMLPTAPAPVVNAIGQAGKLYAASWGREEPAALFRIDPGGVWTSLPVPASGEYGWPLLWRGPEGSILLCSQYALGIDPEGPDVANSGKIWRTDNEGAVWNVIADFGPPDGTTGAAQVKDLAHNEDQLFAVLIGRRTGTTEEAEVWVSSDGGENWLQSNLPTGLGFRSSWSTHQWAHTHGSLAWVGDRFIVALVNDPQTGEADITARYYESDSEGMEWSLIEEISGHNMPYPHVAHHRGRTFAVVQQLPEWHVQYPSEGDGDVAAHPHEVAYIGDFDCPDDGEEEPPPPPPPPAPPCGNCPPLPRKETLTSSLWEA